MCKVYKLMNTLIHVQNYQNVRFHVDFSHLTLQIGQKNNTTLYIVLLKLLTHKVKQSFKTINV